MSRLSTYFLGILCAFCVFADVGTLASAQEMQEQPLHVKTGELFEVLGFSSTPQMTYTWVLEQDGTFLQATRNGLFQTRLTQPGNYALNVQAVDSQGTTVQRKFSVIVEERTPEDAEMPIGTTLVTTEPALDSQNRIIRQSNTDIFILVPAREDIGVFIADLDTQYDSNGDGFSDNDEDTAGSTFRSGLARLHVWVVNPVDSQDIRVTGITETEESVTQTLRVTSRAAVDGGTGENFFPPEVSSTASTSSSPTIPDGEFGTINARVEPNGAIAFSATLRDFTAEDPLLLHWDFGDTEQSLLSSPVHKYASPGTYTVHLTVRDLRSGEELAVLTNDIIVSGEAAASSSSIESNSSSSQDVTEPVENTDNSSIFGLLGKLILAFVVAGGIGALIAFGLSRIRRGKTLEQTFADAEKNLMNKNSQVVDLPPLQLADDPEDRSVIDVTPQEPAPTKKSMEPSLEQLQTEADKAPSWLKPGIERAEEMDYSVTTPVPAPLQTEAAPMPVVESTPPAEQPLPDWLQPQAAPTPEPTPAPAPIPEPEVIEAPEPQPEMTKTEVVAEPAAVEPEHAALTPKIEELQTQKEEAPSWLQAGLTQAEQAGISAATPIPATPEPTVPAEEVTPTPTASAPTPPAPQPAVAPTPVPGAPTKSADELAREERLREKRREKRKRYRDNKKKREGEEKALAGSGSSPASMPGQAPIAPAPEKPVPTSEPQTAATSEPTSSPILQAGEITEDEPVAYIRADSIEEQQNTDTQSQNGAS